MYVKPKKGLGQHFLNDEDIAWRIVEALFKVLDNTKTETPMGVMEVGAGTGVLTKYMLKREDIDFKIAEIDTESVEYLLQKYPVLSSKLHEEDFLRMKLEKKILFHILIKFIVLLQEKRIRLKKIKKLMRLKIRKQR